MPKPPQIYCRVENNTTQTPAVALLQVASGEVWGSSGRFNGSPVVRAYPRSLGAARGIEFTTQIAPELGSSSPYETRWYLDLTPGVQKRVKNGDDFASITAVVQNFQP